MYPKVTVVIPFYNCPYIDRAIASALNQTYPNVEIIVVDDGSTRHTDKIYPYMNRIHYLGKANGGTASAVNYGIRCSSGEYIAWLSSDDMFMPHKIMRQVTFMEMNRSSFCFTAYATTDKSDGIKESFVGTALSGPKDIYRLLFLYNPINGCTMMAKRSLFDRHGYFNERLIYTHDYDMWLRLALGGARLDYLPEALTIYRFHEEMGTIRHRPELLNEYASVQAHYRDLMNQLLQSLV